MKSIVTHHVSIERFDRIEYIIDTIGLGDEVILEAMLPNAENVMRRMQITNTGVLLVKALDDDILVTAWIAKMDQAIRICRSAGRIRMPDSLYRRIQQNKKYADRQP